MRQLQLIILGNVTSVLQHFCPTVLPFYYTSDLRQVQVGCTLYFVNFVNLTYAGTADLVSTEVTVLSRISVFPLYSNLQVGCTYFVGGIAHFFQVRCTTFVGWMPSFVGRMSNFHSLNEHILWGAHFLQVGCQVWLSLGRALRPHYLIDKVIAEMCGQVRLKTISGPSAACTFMKLAK